MVRITCSPLVQLYAKHINKYILRYSVYETEQQQRSKFGYASHIIFAVY